MLPWVEIVVGENVRLSMIICKIYSVLKHHGKLFVQNLMARKIILVVEKPSVVILRGVCGGILYES
jgi:hypothetical protein